jgi:uncharacterized protein (DUF4415 family)
MTKKLSESSPQGRQPQPKASDTFLTGEIVKELANLKNRKIDLTDEDAPEITNWNEAVIGKFYRPIKKQVTVRLDADVLDWFKNSADKYQTLINTACRDYMNNHR